jgi:hypothetical protein
MLTPDATSETAVVEAIQAVRAPEPGEGADLPAGLLDWLVRLRLLGGVPFSYLVPHPDMLPLESVRFFYLNRNWLDAAVDGALSLGASTTRDRLHLETLYADLRDALDGGERQAWARSTGTQLEEGEAEAVTGFLLRSRLVAGWPGLHVCAFRGSGADEPVRLLRVDRLGPSVLLVLFDGVPDRVQLEEPRVAAQFGVDPDNGGRSLRVRDPATGLPVGDRTVVVPFRANAPGVIDMSVLRERLLSQAGDVLGQELIPAELALQLLQYPFCQPFGQTNASMAQVFRPTIDIQVLRSSHEAQS